MSHRYPTAVPLKRGVFPHQFVSHAAVHVRPMLAEAAYTMRASHERPRVKVWTEHPHLRQP